MGVFYLFFFNSVFHFFWFCFFWFCFLNDDVKKEERARREELRVGRRDGESRAGAAGWRGREGRTHDIIPSSSPRGHSSAFSKCARLLLLLLRERLLLPLSQTRPERANLRSRRWILIIEKNQIKIPEPGRRRDRKHILNSCAARHWTDHRDAQV